MFTTTKTRKHHDDRETVRRALEQSLIDFLNEGEDVVGDLAPPPLSDDAR